MLASYKKHQQIPTLAHAFTLFVHTTRFSIAVIDLLPVSCSLSGFTTTNWRFAFLFFYSDLSAFSHNHIQFMISRSVGVYLVNITALHVSCTSFASSAMFLVKPYIPHTHILQSYMYKCLYL